MQRLGYKMVSGIFCITRLVQRVLGVVAVVVRRAFVMREALGWHSRARINILEVNVKKENSGDRMP